MNYLAVAIQPVHLESVSNAELARIIRKEAAARGRNHELGIAQALAVVYALKEAHRLGVIRGRAVNEK